MVVYIVGCCVFVMTMLVDVVPAGECCKAYYDLTFEYNSEEWCSEYCCGTSTLGVLECCDNILLQATASDRETLCLDFFSQNIWAPIVIGLGGLGMLICCCVCVAMCCQGSKRSGTVVAPTQPYSTNVIMAPQQQQQPMGGMQPGPPQYAPLPGSTGAPYNSAPVYPPGPASVYPPGPAPVYPPTPGNQYPTKQAGTSIEPTPDASN